MSRCSSTRSPSRSSWSSRSAANAVSGATREPGRAGLPATRAQQRPAEPVVLQQPVPVRAEHGAGVRALAGSISGGSPERSDPAVVDLVAAHRLAPRRAGRLGQVLVRRRTRSSRSSRPSPSASRPRPRAGRRCAARASGSRRRCPAPAARRGVRDDGVGEARCAAARPGRARWPWSRAAPPGRRRPAGTARSRSARRRPARRPAPRRRWRWRSAAAARPPPAATAPPRGGAGRPSTPSATAQRVLGVEPEPVGPRHDAERRTPGERAELVEPGREQRRVAAELVDHEPGDAGLVGRRRAGRACRTGARTRRRGRCRRPPAPAGRRPAPAPCSRCRGPQVDLGGRAGALADHHVVAGAQVGEASR